MSGRKAVVGIALVVLGGLAVAGGAAAFWVEEFRTVQIGGMVIPDDRWTSGVSLTPGLLPAGVGLVLGAGVLAVARGRLRTGTAAAVGMLALVSVGFVVVGLLAARRTPGELLPLPPALSTMGAVAAATGAVLAARRRQGGSVLPSRYDLEAREVEAREEGEWALASDEGAPAPEDDAP